MGHSTDVRVRAESPTQHVASMTFEEETSINLMTPSKPTSANLSNEMEIPENFGGTRTPRQILTAKQLPFWIHFMAGGLAGTVGALVTCPLELVKTRFQSSHFASIPTEKLGARGRELSFFRHPLRATAFHVLGVIDALKCIYKAEGVLALWRGAGAMVVGVMPARAIYFASYNKGKHFFTELNDNNESSMVHVSSAISAGLFTATATNPIWLVKTRIQLQSSSMSGGVQYKHSFDCIQKVFRQEGIRAFYQGLSASYLGVIESTLQWVLYERMKKALADYKGHLNCDYEKTPRDWLDYFLIGAASKWIACISTYPHEVLRTRLRQGRMPDGSNKYLGLRHAIQTIYREEGLVAFYGGMTAHLMRVVPNSAIMLFCYEFFVYFFSKYHSNPYIQ